MKYKIISGSPRSGTSATMRVMRASGYNLHGDKFPRLANNSESEIEQYMHDKKVERFKPEDQLNEQGFFEEGGMVMKGIGKNILSHLHTIPEGSVVKIIGKGLLNTDPDLISKLIYCLRDPITCGLAQLSLRPKRNKGIPFKEERTLPFINKTVSKVNLEIDLFPRKKPRPQREPKGHTTKASGKMWHRDTLAFVTFALAYPHVPIFISDYAEFSTNQANWLEKCSEFLDQTLTGIETITPRSPKPLTEPYWVDLQNAYTLILEGNFIRAKEVLEKVDFSTTSTQFECPRAGIVDKARCVTCYKKEKPALKKMMIRRSERLDIDWKNEPCFVECAEHGMSVQESITNNFWRTK